MICRCCASPFQPLAHEHICDECADMNFISSPLAGINDRSTVAHRADSPSNILLENPARGYFAQRASLSVKSVRSAGEEVAPVSPCSRLATLRDEPAIAGQFNFGGSGSRPGMEADKSTADVIWRSHETLNHAPAGRDNWQDNFKQAAGVGPGESHKLSVKRGATPRLCNHFNRLLLFSCLPIDFAPEPLLRLEIGGNSGATLLKGASL